MQFNILYSQILAPVVKIQAAANDDSDYQVKSSNIAATTVL